ncbi:MAG TPA: anthrone oxygenase family protein [Candidatus Saccharimonadales bacterium]|nr:anthrone oxygenase family protein [Candidatus Saccharimonadales bacterium]
MIFAVQMSTMLFVALAMSMAVAHALELPGKLRLKMEAYLAVQTIYDPGFTLGGIIEPLCGVATLALFFLSRGTDTDSWLLLIAFAALLVMHLVFWFVTRPVNKFWLKTFQTYQLSGRFFDGGQAAGPAPRGGLDAREWKSMRDRWEASHLVRAMLSLIAFLALSAAVLRG